MALRTRRGKGTARESYPSCPASHLALHKLLLLERSFLIKQNLLESVLEKVELLNSYSLWYCSFRILDFSFY